MLEPKKGLSQETLKIIACITMLIDHIGAVLFPSIRLLRIIGRIAFPIFCFLLVEGVYHTKHPVKYGFRLCIGLLLAEIPFDILFFGGFTWQHQSVMVTLLLGYIMLQIIMKVEPIYKILIVFLFAMLADLFNTDYGSFGICLIAIFMLTRETKYNILIQAISICLLSILFYGINSTELFCIFALLFIVLYSDKKVTYSKVLQWAFYLFYPVHLTLLALVNYLLTYMRGI